MRIQVDKATRIVFASADTGATYTYRDPSLPYDPNDQRKVLCVDDDASCDDGDPWFLFYVADCFDPPLTAIRARSWEAAYYQFVEIEADRGHYVIDDNDPDYGPDDGTYTDNGRRVDTESFQGFAA